MEILTYAREDSNYSQEQGEAADISTVLCLGKARWTGSAMQHWH